MIKYETQREGLIYETKEMTFWLPSYGCLLSSNIDDLKEYVQGIADKSLEQSEGENEDHGAVRREIRLIKEKLQVLDSVIDVLFGAHTVHEGEGASE